MLDSLDGDQWVEALGFYYMEPWHFDPRLPVARPGEDATHPLYGLSDEARRRMPEWQKAGFRPVPRAAVPTDGEAPRRSPQPFPDKPLPPEEMLAKVMMVNKQIGGTNLWRPRGPSAPARPLSS